MDHYVEVELLERHRNDILVYMKFKSVAKPHDLMVKVRYDKDLYANLRRKCWNPWKEEPCQGAGEVCSVLRRVVKKHNRVICFYNYDYELEILRSGLEKSGICYAEWNGHKHEALPEGEKWCYLVQYTAGAEGWNCIETNCIVFFSDTYSYKASVQAKGRIDRLTTPFSDLYYYHLRSSSSIDTAIFRCLEMKKDFNERRFIEGNGRN